MEMDSRELEVRVRKTWLCMFALPIDVGRSFNFSEIIPILQNKNNSTYLILIVRVKWYCTTRLLKTVRVTDNKHSTD